jgi:hypothetical protein
MGVADDKDVVGRFAKQILEDRGYRQTWVTTAEAD